MKKITLIFSALLAGVAMQAQNDLVVESNVTPNQVERAEAEVLFDQPIGDTSGIVSDVFAGLGGGTYSAEDLELDIDAQITSMKFYGFQNQGNLPDLLLGLELHIYADAGGSPSGTPLDEDALYIIELDAAGAAAALDLDGGAFDFVVDLSDEEVVLMADTKYWVSVAPVLDMDDITAALRWNWYASLPDQLDDAHLIDQLDLFGLGQLTWGSLSSLGLDFNSLAFTVEGEEATVSVNDNVLAQVAVYPNPANEVIYLSTPATLEVTNVTLYDILGKNTGVTLNNGAINISSLARGVYMLNIETNHGSITKKIMKR